MIVKIDHLAFCSMKVGEDMKAFARLGYTPDFVEMGVRDVENKKEFMTHLSGRLDMAQMTRPGSICVELLSHGHVVVRESYVLPVFEGAVFNVERSDDCFVVDGCCFVKARSSCIRAECFILEGSKATEFRCNKIIVDANNVERAADFWSSLGFKRVVVSESVAHLQFRAPFGMGLYELYVRKSKVHANGFCLDSCGFNCLALFSTDAGNERRRFEALGIAATQISVFRVNGKQLRIFWLRGPCGEIVEVISLA